MRIPLTRADFEIGTFTKLSKSLRKAWPTGDISLMQAQNALAASMGYNNLHEAHICATETLQLSPGWTSLEKMRNSMAWSLFLRYDIGLLHGATMLSKLHLATLSCGEYTVDKVKEREAALLRERMIFVDEYGDYVHAKEYWPSETPQLLAKGLLPYRWAISKDRQLYTWDALRTQIKMLPETYIDDLAHAGKISGCHDTHAFVLDSLLPTAWRPIGEALAADSSLIYKVAGDQWALKWLVTKDGDELGCCIVADGLGGIIPRVYPKDGIEATKDLGALICGDSLQAELAPANSKIVAESIWLLSRHNVDFMRTSPERFSAELLQGYDRLPEHISITSNGHGIFLSGPTFFEVDQVYAVNPRLDLNEQKKMLMSEPICCTYDCASKIVDAVSNSSDIPALGSLWLQTVGEMFSSRKDAVEAVLATTEGRQVLVRAVLTQIDPSVFDANMMEAIDESLPLRYPEGLEDDPDLVRERNTALAQISSLGGDIVQTMPQLSRYSATSLGALALYSQGHYPGSRNSWLANCPNNDTDRSYYMAALLLHEALCAGKVQARAVMCAIAPAVLPTATVPTQFSLVDLYRSAYKVESMLTRLAAQQEKISIWRDHATKAADQAKGGEFLRFGEKLPTSQPLSMAETMQEMMKFARVGGAAIKPARLAKP